MQLHQRKYTTQVVCQSFCCRWLPASFRGAPRELWIVWVMQMLNAMSFFASGLVLMPYLHQDFGYTDFESGTVYGVSGFLASVLGIVFGSVIDALGVKRSYIISSIIGASAAVTMGLARSRGWVSLAMFVLMPVATSLGAPVLTIGMKQFSSSENHNLAYGVFYAMMNVGAVVAGPAVDAIRFAAADGVRYKEYTVSYPRIVFLLGGIITLVGALIVALFMRNIYVNKFGVVYLVSSDQSDESSAKRSAVDDNEEIAGEAKPWRKFVWSLRGFFDPLKQRFFWKLALFNFALTPVGMIFRHLEATLPTWLLRTLGNNVAYGTLYIVDPLCVIVLTIVFPIFFSRFSVYRRMIVGSAISALSVFLLAMQTSELSVIMFGVVLSIGESLYSPLTYMYTMSLAPHKKEGSYTALSSAPFLTTRLFVGWISAALLHRYCPLVETDDSSRNQCPIVWVWVGAIALLTPLMLFLFMKFIHDSETQIRLSREEDGRGREDAPEDLLDIIERPMDLMNS